VRYLLDTNILSEIGRAQPDARVMKNLRVSKAECATSAITWHELQYGVLRLPVGRKRSNLEKLMSQFSSLPILAYDEEIAVRHAVAKVALATMGKPMPGVDGQIAAIAEAHGLILVTRYEVDFQNYPGLKIENWFTP